MKDGKICTHIEKINPVVPLSFDCDECVKKQTHWRGLRLCLICGYVGCSDDSPNQHAKHHALSTAHAIVMSLEAGEDWQWCYLDEVYV